MDRAVDLWTVILTAHFSMKCVLPDSEIRILVAYWMTTIVAAFDSLITRA